MFLVDGVIIYTSNFWYLGLVAVKYSITFMRLHDGGGFIFFNVHPYLEMIQFDDMIFFQMGWVF